MMKRSALSLLLFPQNIRNRTNQKSVSHQGKKCLPKPLMGKLILDTGNLKAGAYGSINPVNIEYEVNDYEEFYDIRPAVCSQVLWL